MQVSGVEFWTTTKDDLIVAKLNWSRDTYSEMQIRDIANMTSSEYDSEYVAKWVERLGLSTIWATLLKSWTDLRAIWNEFESGCC